MKPNAEFLIVLMAWIIAGGAGAFFFWSRNAKLKRRLWPLFAVGGSILFLGFVWWIVPIEVFYVMAPLTALITLINLRVFKFCDECGATSQNIPFQRARFCARCGAPLQ